MTWSRLGYLFFIIIWLFLVDGFSIFLVQRVLKQNRMFVSVFKKINVVLDKIRWVRSGRTAASGVKISHPDLLKRVYNGVTTSHWQTTYSHDHTKLLPVKWDFYMFEQMTTTGIYSGEDSLILKILYSLCNLMSIINITGYTWAFHVTEGCEKGLSKKKTIFSILT